MWIMVGNFVVPQYYSKLKVFEEETYASLNVRIKQGYIGLLYFTYPKSTYIDL